MKTLIHRFFLKYKNTSRNRRVFIFKKKRDEGQSAYLFFSIESRSNIPIVRKSTDNINPRIKLKKGTPVFSIFLKPNLITLLKEPSQRLSSKRHLIHSLIGSP
ncbi:hypothetical protein GTP07_14095 [Lactococcus lactis]|nr:hypothetical protein [Lactococcus lactis]